MWQCDRVYVDLSPVALAVARRRDTLPAKPHGGAAGVVARGALPGVRLSARAPRSPTSAAGTRRLLWPAREAVTAETNLYFSGMHCAGRRGHRVTIVAVRHGTAADRFCRDRLLQLDAEGNVFVRRDARSGRVYVTPAAHSPARLRVDLWCPEGGVRPAGCVVVAVAERADAVGGRDPGGRDTDSCRYCHRENPPPVNTAR